MEFDDGMFMGSGQAPKPLDLARLRAFVEQVKGRHREWSTLADGIRCPEDYQRCPCDAARLATLAEGLLRVVENSGALLSFVRAKYPKDEQPDGSFAWACEYHRALDAALAALARLEVGDA